MSLVHPYNPCHKRREPVRKIPGEPLPKKLAPPMTQIVGIICKESIIIASESQYTLGYSAKQFEGRKMDVITFLDGNQALVAFAGAIKSALIVTELMKESAKDSLLVNELSVIKIAKAAISAYRSDRLEFYNQGLDSPPDQQDALFGREDEFFEFVIAHYSGGDPNQKQPCLFKIDVLSGKPERIHSYAVTGSGSHLASFMLAQFKYEDMPRSEALALAVDALERIKESDLYCGGQLRIAVIDPKIFKNTMVAFMPDDITSRIAERLRTLRAESIANQKAKFADVVKQIHREDYEKIMQQIRAETAEAVKAFEAKHPENTLAIGEEAVRKSAEKWNKEHPDTPVPIDEWIADAKKHKPPENKGEK